MPIVVRISPDTMKAVAVLTRQEHEALDEATLQRALLDFGITFGIDQAACRSLIERAHAALPDTAVEGTVACGITPVRGDDGRVDLAVEYKREAVGHEDAAGHIDFHDHGAFTPIVKDQLIARVVHPTPGTPGRDVLGHEIATQAGERARATAGPGTTLAEGGAEVRATRDGDLRCDGTRFEVMDVIRVRGDLAFETGNIDCEGSVRVEGDVRPGFHIHARGDVTIGGVVDSAEVTSRGKVSIRLGAVRGSSIRGSEITVGYVNGSYLESEGDVRILKEAVSGTVVAGGSITMPGAGRALGGSLQARHAIEIGSAGSAKGVTTLLLAAAVDPLRQVEATKLAASIESNARVKNHIERVRELAESSRDEELKRLLSRSEGEIAARSERLAAVGGNSNPDESHIRVRGALHAGVRIQIGSSQLAIQEDKQGGTFRHDPESGAVIALFGSGRE